MLRMDIPGSVESSTRDLTTFLCQILLFLRYLVLPLTGPLNHLTIDFTFEEEPVRGPGIVKVNSKILDDPVVVLQIGTAIEEMMSQSDDSWNPHARLEFLKVAI
jgi:hypothetical protein